MHDSETRTVRIPVEIRQGQLIFRCGGNLKSIRHGAMGELIIDSLAVEDQILRDELLQEATHSILPAGVKLYFHVNSERTPEKLRQHLEKPASGVHGNGAYVAAILKSELFLRLRGTKSATLEGCVCFIPALEETAASVNHAYSLISQAFEPQRRSHTANVFNKDLLE